MQHYNNDNSTQQQYYKKVVKLRIKEVISVNITSKWRWLNQVI